MGETKISSEIKEVLNSFLSAIQVYRNNVGRIKNISFGLCKGSGDLVGWRTVKITPEMVGKNIAVFLSIEVKDIGKHIKQGSDQDQWRKAVTLAGGIAIETDSIQGVLEKINNWIFK